MAKWAKGVSGNPAGRPVNPAVSRAKSKLHRNLAAVVDALIKAALDGDARAMRLILERTIPPITADYEALEQRIAALESSQHD